MLDIMFTRYNEHGEPTICQRIGSATTSEAADAKMMEMFVDFCRDVSKKPLTREHYANGFEWRYQGLKHQLYYISQEVS